MILTNYRLIDLPWIFRAPQKWPSSIPQAIPFDAIESVKPLPSSRFLFSKGLPGVEVHLRVGKRLRFYSREATAWIDALGERLRES
jgi:hypothetical protein